MGVRGSGGGEEGEEAMQGRRQGGDENKRRSGAGEAEEGVQIGNRRGKGERKGAMEEENGKKSRVQKQKYYKHHIQRHIYEGNLTYF